MQIINIFLASSITELRTERNEIDVFLRKLSDWLEEEHGITLHPVRCENIDPKYTIERKQEEYNQYLRDCDLAFFVFWSRVGEYTREEFEVARKQFEEAGRPLCYVYVIEKDDKRCEASLPAFLEELEHIHHVPYERCHDMEELKKQMKKNILSYGRSLLYDINTLR